MADEQPWQLPFFTFWSAQAASLFGSGLVQFAMVWWLTQTTGSATVLATATLVAMLPGILIGPLAGVLVDRWNRRTVIILADGTGALTAAALAVLYWTGDVQVWHIYAIMFIRSIAGVFHFPAVQSSTTMMVPSEQLTRAAGLNQTLHGLTMITTPPLGALLLSLLSMHWIMAIDVATAAVAIGLLFLVHIPQPKLSAAPAGGSAPLSIWRDLRSGFGYIWSWPGLLGLMILSTILNLLLTPAFSLLPILVVRHFNGQALQLGWLNAAYGGGFVAGGILLSAWGGFRRRVFTSMLGLAGLGCGVLLIGLTPAQALPLAVGAMALVGLMNPITNGPFFAVIQAVVAPEMQGRVFTVLSSISTGMSPLGLAIAGPVADHFGVQVWYLVGGVTCLVMLVVILLTPAILNLEDGGRMARPQEAPLPPE